MAPHRVTVLLLCLASAVALLPARYSTRAGRSSREARRRVTPFAKTGVLFDFDGTLGDTETPAMQVAYWELAPFFPETSRPSCSDYVRDNAGRPFEAMVEDCDAERAAAGLPPIEEARSGVAEALGGEVLRAIDENRAAFGLPSLTTAIPDYADLLTMQKEETVSALSACANTVPHCKEMLAGLDGMNVPYCIATTSGKPRVPVSIDACGLRPNFTPESVHSGESDFDPPRFKPDPAVYLKAAEWLGVDPAEAVAVEDSASGVGSASNAGVGLIVGYVGASHIAQELKASHAAMLMQGTRADSGRGAAVVIEDMRDLPAVVKVFQDQGGGTEGVWDQGAGPFTGVCDGPVFTP